MYIATRSPQPHLHMQICYDYGCRLVGEMRIAWLVLSLGLSAYGVLDRDPATGGKKHIHIHIYIYIYTYVHIYLYAYTCVSVFFSVSLYIYHCSCPAMARPTARRVWHLWAHLRGADDPGAWVRLAGQWDTKAEPSMLACLHVCLHECMGACMFARIHAGGCPAVCTAIGMGADPETPEPPGPQAVCQHRLSALRPGCVRPHLLHNKTNIYM